MKAKQENCLLLPVDQRVFPVPRKQKGGMGQANVWYADQPENAHFRQTVLKFIAKGAIPVVKKQLSKNLTWHPDPYIRKKVEEKAINCTINHYEGLGYTVNSFETDNVGWDLEAAFNNKLLRLEVKGLSGAIPVIEMTPNEYQKMKEYQDSYRICVVTNALGNKPILSIFAYSSESGAWEDEACRQLMITEIVSARMALL